MRGIGMLQIFKNFTNKRGMTLGELLVVFVIMGIIAGMTMVTVKPNEKSLKYVYYRIYNSIGTAFYNSSINMAQELREDPAMDKQFPTTAELFCKLLLEYMNSKNDNTTCSNDKTVDVDNPVFSEENVQFIASNGVKIWIGHSKGAENKGNFSTLTATDNTNTEFSVRYFFVFADLNGGMGPNSPVSRGKGMADIVGFIVTEDYDVVPIGIPEVDPRYFTARVAYSINAGLDAEDVTTSMPMPYLQAKRHAWGMPSKAFYVSSNEPMSMNFYDGVNITNASPFWLDYNDEKYNEVMAETVNQNCGHNPHQIAPDDEDSPTIYDVEADACYITIKDFY